MRPGFHFGGSQRYDWTWGKIRTAAQKRESNPHTMPKRHETYC
jgi:hypothetical protein